MIAFRYQLPDLRETTIIFNPRCCSGGGWSTPLYRRSAPIKWIKSLKKIIRAVLTPDIHYYLLLHRCYVYVALLCRRHKSVKLDRETRYPRRFEIYFKNYLKSCFSALPNKWKYIRNKGKNTVRTRINGSRAIGKPTETVRGERITRNHKVSSRMHHGIKIYKYFGGTY